MVLSVAAAHSCVLSGDGGQTSRAGRRAVRHPDADRAAERAAVPLFARAGTGTGTGDGRRRRGAQSRHRRFGEVVRRRSRRRSAEAAGVPRNVRPPGRQSEGLRAPGQAGAGPRRSVDVGGADFGRARPGGRFDSGAGGRLPGARDRRQPQAGRPRRLVAGRRQRGGAALGGRRRVAAVPPVRPAGSPARRGGGTHRRRRLDRAGSGRARQGRARQAGRGVP